MISLTWQESPAYPSGHSHLSTSLASSPPWGTSSASSAVSSQILEILQRHQIITSAPTLFTLLKGQCTQKWKFCHHLGCFHTWFGCLVRTRVRLLPPPLLDRGSFASSSQQLFTPLLSNDGAGEGGKMHKIAICTFIYLRFWTVRFVYKASVHNGTYVCLTVHSHQTRLARINRAIRA